MAKAKLLTSTEIQAALKQRGLRPNKDYGQNFLIDHNLLRFIVDHAEVGRDDLVVEIGVGNANLTRLLAERAGCVMGVEIDKGLYQWAREESAGCSNVVLIHDDILHGGEINANVWQQCIQNIVNYRRMKIVSNLPYAICTPFLIGVLAVNTPFERMVLMLPSEIAARMRAQPGGEQYGILSVALAVATDIAIVKKVPKQAFWPQPKVQSMIVDVRPLKQPVVGYNEFPSFVDMVRRLFNYRRKTMNACIKLAYPDTHSQRLVREALESAGLNTSRRAETLAPNEWVALFRSLREPLPLQAGSHD